MATGGRLLHVRLRDIVLEEEDHLRDLRAGGPAIEIGMRREESTGQEASRQVAALRGDGERRPMTADTEVLATAAHRRPGAGITVRTEEVVEDVVQAIQVMAAAGVGREVGAEIGLEEGVKFRHY